MKHLKHLLTALLLLCSSVICAHDFEVDGIYYNVLSEEDKTVEVTFKGSSYSEYSNEYLGDVIMPISTIYDGINYSVIGIGNYAFASCKEIKKVIIPSSIVSIGKGAFYRCDNLQEIHINNLMAWFNIDFGNDSANPLYNSSYNTTALERKLFLNGDVVTELIIPVSITSIKDYTFYGYKGLTCITIPNNVVSIGNKAFYNCTNLKTVYNESSLNLIKGNSTHGNVAEYANVIYIGTEDIQGDFVFRTINNTNYLVAYIGDETEIVLPERYNGWKKYVIGERAFYNCDNLLSVTLSSGITNIGEYAFFACWGLTNIVIPDGVSSIGRYAFGSCSGLKNVTISNSVTSIEWGAFSSCRSLKEFNINNGSNSLWLAGSIFSNTPLETLYLGRNVTLDRSYPSIAFGKIKDLKTVGISNYVTSVEKGMFEECTNLSNVYFESNPTIGANAIPSTAKCHLMLNDNNVADFNTANTNTFADVSYTRTISEGKYGTIILPFAPDAASIENYAFYELVESGEGYMKFDEVAQPIANTPYIYTLREGKENVAITGGETTISSNIETPVVSEWETIGSFSKQTIDTSNGNYYALSATNNEINRITKNLTVLPYRAYFKSANASKSALNIYISGTTGVEMISSNEIDGFENGGIFDLSGRKVAEPRKGNVYIKNGKKIMF